VGEAPRSAGTTLRAARLRGTAPRPLGCARAQRAALETALTAHTSPRPPSRQTSAKLQTIPGVGPIVAATVLAVFSNA